MTGIRDVAKLAKVSPATVSRVMNGTANVNEEKRLRVLAAIEETGFRPNEVARSLYKKSSRIIGMVVPNIENPFINELAKAVEDEAYKSRYQLVFFNSEEHYKKEVESIRMLEQMNADGIILMTNNDGVKEAVIDCHVPLVSIDRRVRGKNVIAWLQSDHYIGGQLSAEHLVACGCRNIVNMRGLQKYSSAKERYQGYTDICEQYGLNPQYVECAYDFEDGLKKSEELINKFPDVDGIIAANDVVAISLYKCLNRHGFRVPEDIQVVGYDNINLSSLFTPELTTIAQPIKEMGRTAARIIIQNAQGKEIQKENVFQVHLIRRRTTMEKV